MVSTFGGHHDPQRPVITQPGAGGQPDRCSGVGPAAREPVQTPVVSEPVQVQRHPGDKDTRPATPPATRQCQPRARPGARSSPSRPQHRAPFLPSRGPRSVLSRHRSQGGSPIPRHHERICPETRDTPHRARRTDGIRETAETPSPLVSRLRGGLRFRPKSTTRPSINIPSGCDVRLSETEESLGASPEGPVV